MKYCLLLSVALLVVVSPCASADKNADPYRHAHSHHPEAQTRKSHRAVGGPKQSTSNENAQLAKLERQTAQIHSTPPHKAAKPNISASKPQGKTASGQSMNFTNHQQKEHSTTASAPQHAKNGIPR